MIYKTKQGYALMPFLAIYEQNNQINEQYVSNKADLEVYAYLGHIRNLKFENVAYSEEQKIRIENVKDSKDALFQEVLDYVMKGILPTNSQLQNEITIKTMQATIDELMMQNLMGGI
ncbi:hypothetical protein AAK938_01230 [Aerococcaceae bacterium 50-4]